MKKEILAGILLATILLAGCIQGPPVGGTEETIKIGAILPLSGSVAIFGEWAKQGMELALEDIESDRIVLVFEDSKNDAKEGISAFQKLTGLENAGVIISSMSGVSIPLIPLSEEKNMLLLLQDVTYPNITDGKPTVVRHFIQSDREAAVLAGYALEGLGVKKAGILFVNDEAGVGAKEAFKEVFGEKGGTVLVNESYLGKDTGMKTQITKIKDANVDAIYLFGNGPSWVAALRQIRELGFEGVVLTNTAMFIPNFREAAGNAAEGVYFTYPYADPSSESAKKFASSYKEKYGTEPAIEAYYGWDLVHIIAKALEKNNWKMDNLKQKIVEMKEFEGAFGKTKITEQGDFLTKAGIATIENGKIKEVMVSD